MKKYGVRLSVHLSSFVEVEADSEKEAKEKALQQFDKEDLMGGKYFLENEYYDGVEADVEY